MASITPEELAKQIEAGAAPFILDVRSEKEFEAGHVPGAFHIPFGSVGDPGVTVPSRPADPLIVYCGHGPRAWIAAAALRKRGYTRISYLRGHMSGWKRRRLPQE